MSKDYYKGGYRVLLGGVPCRVSFEPSRHALALLRLDSHPNSWRRGGREYNAAQYAVLREERDAVDWSQPGFVFRAGEK